MKRHLEKYSIIKGGDNPLSCDVALINGEKYIYVFEVGNSKNIANKINNIKKEKNVILSHFHEDHIHNIKEIKYRKLYVGDNTFKYTKEGIVVGSNIEIEDGINLSIFKINTCHAKGSIGLIFSDYAFVGDALAPMNKNNKMVYNVQKLKEEIEQFENLNVKYLVSSHKMENPIPKSEAIAKLKNIYSKMQKGDPYIIVE